MSDSDEIYNGQNQSITNRLIVAMYSSVCGPKMTVMEVCCQVTNDTTAQSRKFTKDLWKKKINNIYIHGVGMTSPHRHKHARCSHIMVCNKTVKTAHIKARKHTLTPSYIHSSVHACTQTHTEGQIYIKCTLFLGLSIRLKPRWITVNTIKISKQKWMKTIQIPDGSEHNCSQLKQTINNSNKL